MSLTKDFLLCPRRRGGQRLYHWDYPLNLCRDHHYGEVSTYTVWLITNENSARPAESYPCVWRAPCADANRLFEDPQSPAA